jgi:hypothetical protein
MFIKCSAEVWKRRVGVADLLLPPHHRRSLQGAQRPGVYAIKALFTRTVALLIFVMSDWFCQAVCPILPGSLTDFEIGIFLSLCLILCNVMSVCQMLTKIGLMAWQNQSDSKNSTNFGCIIYMNDFFGRNGCNYALRLCHDACLDHIRRDDTNRTIYVCVISLLMVKAGGTRTGA